MKTDIGGEPNQVFMNQSHSTVPYLSPENAGSMQQASSSTSTSSPSSFSNPATSPMLYNMDELLRMKRKEKHMAPIDCSGVSEAFNVTWKCKQCDRQHAGKNECDHYRNYHNPRHFVFNHPDNRYELPNELESRADGIYSGKQSLKPFTRLGPLKGQVSS